MSNAKWILNIRFVFVVAVREFLDFLLRRRQQNIRRRLLAWHHHRNHPHHFRRCSCATTSLVYFGFTSRRDCATNAQYRPVEDLWMLFSTRNLNSINIYSLINTQYWTSHEPDRNVLRWANSSSSLFNTLSITQICTSILLLNTLYLLLLSLFYNTECCKICLIQLRSG